METTTTYRIPAWRFESLAADVATLAKRAARLASKGALVDAGAIGLEKLGQEIVKVDGRDELVFVVRVLGAAPRLAGWSFVATLQHEEGGTILRTVPTAVVADGELARFRHVAPACDHCGVDRRRNDSFVVRSDAGALKQVGRNCLQDFIGGVSPASMARLAEILAAIGEVCEEAEGAGFSTTRERAVDTLLGFLAVVATIIRLRGWLSRTAARAQERGHAATSNLAGVAMHPYPGSRDDVAWAREVSEAYTPADGERAAAALAMAEEKLLAEGADLTDYEHNLRVIVTGGFVAPRTAGIAASLLVWHERQLGIIRERSRTAASQHVGTVGKREVFTAKLVSLKGFESAFGVRVLARFEDASGNVLTWWTSGDAGFAETEGETYTFKATVKKHDDYKGTKQTVLTRCAPHVEKPKAARKRKPRHAAYCVLSDEHDGACHDDKV